MLSSSDAYGRRMKATILLALAAIGCGTSNRDISTLREAIDNSVVSMSDMATVAEGSMPEGRAITAELRVRGGIGIYEYTLTGQSSLHDIQIDTVDGVIVSSAVVGSGQDTCPDSISLVDAIGIAEGQVDGGTVIAAIPDDDVACAREIQVLAPDLLWEVKVDGDGTVLELEESDETTD